MGGQSGRTNHSSAISRSRSDRAVAPSASCLRRFALPCSLTKRVTASSINLERWPRGTARSSILTVCSGRVMLSRRFIGISRYLYILRIHTIYVFMCMSMRPRRAAPGRGSPLVWISCGASRSSGSYRSSCCAACCRCSRSYCFASAVKASVKRFSGSVTKILHSLDSCTAGLQ